MITQSIIPEKLKSFDYYLNKIPQYLRSSVSFQEHFRIWYDLLVKGVTNNADILLNLLLIFDPKYLEYLQSIDEEMSPDSTYCDILDKLGNIFGVTRHFKVTYKQQGVDITEQLTLDNTDFLILIKAQIIRNYCEGTRKQISDYYLSVGLKMYIQSDDNSPATANMYLATGVQGSNYSYSENVRKMFLAGMLRIESVGIKYVEAFVDMSALLFWDTINEDNSNGWGDDTYQGGEWAI